MHDQTNITMAIYIFIIFMHMQTWSHLFLLILFAMQKYGANIYLSWSSSWKLFDIPHLLARLFAAKDKIVDRANANAPNALRSTCFHSSTHKMYLKKVARFRYKKNLHFSTNLIQQQFYNETFHTHTNDVCNFLSKLCVLNAYSILHSAAFFPDKLS